MDQYKSYVGKVDREMVMDRHSDRVYSRMTSCTRVHARINDIKKQLDKSLTPEEGANLYLEVRSLRHDNWCEFINETCKIRGAVIEDTKVGEFVREYISNEVNVPAEISNKTPDILVLGNNQNVVYLGDVSVSINPSVARARKHEKYLPIKNYLNSLGITVQTLSFNVNENCTNLASEINHLVRHDFIESHPDTVALYETYSIACNSLMLSIREVVDDKKAMQDMIDRADNIKFDNPIMPDIPFEIRSSVDLEYVPTLSEDELIEMIKAETDIKHNGKYFSKNISDSIDAINKIVDNNANISHMAPKSTLKVVDNSYDLNVETDLSLIRDYVDDILNADDSNAKELVLHLLPTLTQLDMMKKAGDKKMTHTECKQDQEMKANGVFGKYQYKIQSTYCSSLVNKYKAEIVKGKKDPNVKKEPSTINLSSIESYHNFISNSIDYYGSLSKKPQVLSDDWEAATKFENDSTILEKEMYDYTIRTNGAQLCQSMAHLYDRVSHLSTSLSIKDNVFIPPNGSFIAVIPGNHAPVTSKNVDLPFIFITRCNKEKVLHHIEHEHYFESDKFGYYVSKLCRLNVDKMSNWANASFKLISTASYLLSKSRTLQTSRTKVIGTLTYFILDVHQKTSEYLDLFKYISFMPFADISRLPNLISDKMDLLMKTRMDGWMLHQLKWFIRELGDKSKLNAVKPVIKKFNTDIVSSSLGITMCLPSFCNPDLRYRKPEDFIEEINVMNTVRPKHLYGSQFMDKSITQTCEWNDEYSAEVIKFGDWAVNGCGDGSFPFDSKFCYSSDAIYYAEQSIVKEYSLSKSRVEQKLGSSMYSGYMHKNCNLRGCTKNKSDRSNAADIHTTSLEACLREYERQNFRDEKCTAIAFGIRHIMSGDVQQYSMSEKDQRGGGRPIATPTIGTKAALMLIEKPEAAKGHHMLNNIIVGGKNKLREQCETYKSAISEGTRRGYKMVFQLTEDQTKYSENDNTRKFLTYVKCNKTLSPDVRALQLKVLENMIGREHLIKRMPICVKSSQALSKYIIDSSDSLGVSAYIGWPQGMLNFISTNVHCAADIWITKAYNKAYPNSNVYTKGLVHSDDSWVVVCCNSVDDFERFTIFRMLAKKMFCLKLNEKKLWGSRYMGELVSNYNLNGNVHLSVGKMLANSFGNLSFQNWPVDVHNQISSLQQCYRNGAGLGIIIMLATLLKQQMVRTYNVKGSQLENLGVLPIELGGYPSCSAFELAVTGVTCYYKKLLNICRMKPDSITSDCITKCLLWSIKRVSISEEHVKVDNKSKGRLEYYSKLKDKTLEWCEEDYVDLSIPSRGNVFSALTHILPKSRKLSKTLKYIDTIRDKFPTNGLELIVTKPLSLSESLGHLCAQTTGMVYELAADKYSSSTRRMAISQMIQSTGKVIKIKGMIPMTINELLNFIELSEMENKLDIDILASAFSDDNDVVGITNDIVYHSTHEIADDDKRKIITKMPFIDDKFNTIGRFSDVLLKIIDLESKTDMLYKYSKPNVSDETLVVDAMNLMRVFKSYFKFYEVKAACSLLAQQYFQTLKARLWTQPHMRSDCLTNFLCDLYGKTISNDKNYRVYIHVGRSYERSHDQDITRTIYFTDVLNHIYHGKFIIESVGERSIGDVINDIDYTKLNDDDMLKYSIIQQLHNYNDDYLRKMHSAGGYRDKWEIAQRRIGRVYKGKFSALCSLGQVVVRISGEEGDLSIESNKTDVIAIMHIMQKFVQKNFSYSKYNIHGSWGESPFWRSKNQFSTHYLTYYNRISTVITSERKLCSIPIKIDSSLSYGEEPIGSIVDGFSFDNMLRVVYVIVNGSKYKFLTARQNFTLPCRDEINLEMNFIQGFDCRKLYSTGAIEHLVLDSSHNISSNVIASLLETGFNTINSEPIGQMLTNLISTINRRQYLKYIQSSIAQEEIHEVVLEGVTVKEVVDIDETTSPEDLGCIDIEYVEGMRERSSGICRVLDINRVLCMAYIGKISTKQVESVIYHLLHNESMIDWAKHVMSAYEPDPAIYFDYLDTLSSYRGSSISLRTYAFIISSGLNVTDTWLDLDIINIAKLTDEVDHSQYLKKISQEIVEVNAEFHGFTVETKQSLADLVR
ncbi:RNA-dependent RNA polymerase [Wuhan mosquito virus 1]|uniref:RNA-directed RNA polymerase L n=2 Tax=Wuhan mosquito virus 1 TaxID=1608126 RepID=A0A0B5KTW8_9VIRU|nr:RNA-dependent RNA polymerase [Wuhan mosquito virus 1]AJG39267.1 RNA-dependent RNA polymerase [Wuhan mosquito virus 1]